MQDISQRRSARKHASAPGLSDRSVRRLHDDLHYHLCKMAIVQELSEREGRAPHFTTFLHTYTIHIHHISPKICLGICMPMHIHHISPKICLVICTPHISFHTCHYLQLLLSTKQTPAIWFKMRRYVSQLRNKKALHQKALHYIARRHYTRKHYIT